MNTHVILGIDRCGIVGEDGETHQGIYDLTFLMPIPNLIIATPKDSVEAGNMLFTAINNNDKPFAIRYSKDSLKYQKSTYEAIKIGSWEEIAPGKDACLITYGNLIENAKVIKEKLKMSDDIAIINARFQKPIDDKMYKDILKKYRHIFIYEEQTAINSLGSYLVSYALEHDYFGEIKIFGVPDKYVKQGKKAEVLKALKLDPESIINKIKENMD